jgi:hypothetical protein
LFPFVGGSTLRGGLRAADELAGLVEAGAKRVSGGTRLERHHLLPREFKEYFEEGGLDIEDFVMPLPVDVHRLKPGGLHTGPEHWNKQWRKFILRNPEPDPSDILEHLEVMMRRFGLDG